MRAAAREQAPVAALDYGRARLVVNVASSAVAHSRLHPVAKEPWTVAWLEARVRGDDVLWDVGANVGGYSLIAAAAGAGRVIAVEPSPSNFAALCDNVALNGLGATIVPLPVVLTGSTGLARLEHGDARPGATHRLTDGDEGVPTLGFALDDLLDRFALPAPTLLKLDVDGAEAQVVAGARATLARPELRSVLVEIEERSQDEVVAALAAARFALVERHAERDGVPLQGVWYGVFERV
jgi:FkbM family methyltransferase